MGRAFSRVYLFVCLHSKRKMACAINTKLGTHVHVMYSISVARQRSKGHGHTVRKPSQHIVASDYSSCPVTLCYLRLVPAWLCMLIWMPVFSSLLCVYLTSFLTFFLHYFFSFLMHFFLLIYFLTRLLLDLSMYSFQNRPIPFLGWW